MDHHDVSSSSSAERNAALLRWYRETARILPWRGTPDPYAVLVSECMLQQTQADRVAPRFVSFMERFPTVEALCEAPLAEVLDEWSGLGYNGRARRLRDAARMIATSGWPTDPASLRKLPGVGPYTAAAIASFAFGERVAAVDTNMRRVLSRWHGEALSGPALAAVAEADLDPDAATWNQAVMDLGATICRPAPRCEACPVSDWCTGPDVYQPPRPQSRFEGSHRQRRGAVVRSLVRRSSTLAELATTTGFDRRRLADAIDTLIADGLVDQTEDGRFTLAD